jgi:UrcA family protein
MFIHRAFAARTLSVTAVLLGFLGAEAAMADPQSLQTRSKSVAVGDLDLTTVRGQQIAQERIHQMARRLCSQVADELDLSQQANYVKCVDAAMQSAGQTVQALARRSTNLLANGK